MALMYYYKQQHLQRPGYKLKMLNNSDGAKSQIKEGLLIEAVLPCQR